MYLIIGNLLLIFFKLYIFLLKKGRYFFFKFVEYNNEIKMKVYISMYFYCWFSCWFILILDYFSFMNYFLI